MSSKLFFGVEEFRQVVTELTHAIAKDQAIHGGKEIPRLRAVYGIPRGGVPLAMALASSLNLRLVSEYPVEGLAPEEVLVVDDIADSGNTLDKLGHPGLTATIHAHRHSIVMPTYSARVWAMAGQWIDYWWEPQSEVDISATVLRQLEYIGEDPNREGLLDTPARCVKSWNALYGGYKERPEDVMRTFVEGACDEMVVLKDIEIYSTCEHHMLPFYGKAHIAYIPDGKVIGVSKLARLLDIYARRLQIQERIGQQVTDALMTHLKPRGAACVIEAQHLCMRARGVQKQGSMMITSSLTGVFREDAATRAEFMGLLK